MFLPISNFPHPYSNSYSAHFGPRYEIQHASDRKFIYQIHDFLQKIGTLDAPTKAAFFEKNIEFDAYDCCNKKYCKINVFHVIQDADLLECLENPSVCHAIIQSFEKESRLLHIFLQHFPKILPSENFVTLLTPLLLKSIAENPQDFWSYLKPDQENVIITKLFEPTPVAELRTKFPFFGEGEQIRCLARIISTNFSPKICTPPTFVTQHPAFASIDTKNLNFLDKLNHYALSKYFNLNAQPFSLFSGPSSAEEPLNPKILNRLLEDKNQLQKLFAIAFDKLDKSPYGPRDLQILSIGEFVAFSTFYSTEMQTHGGITPLHRQILASLPPTNYKDCLIKALNSPIPKEDFAANTQKKIQLNHLLSDVEFAALAIEYPLEAADYAMPSKYFQKFIHFIKDHPSFFLSQEKFIDNLLADEESASSPIAFADSAHLYQYTSSSSSDRSRLSSPEFD